MPRMCPQTRSDLGQSCEGKLEGTNTGSGQHSMESHTLATGKMRNCRMPSSRRICHTGFQ